MKEFTRNESAIVFLNETEGMMYVKWLPSDNLDQSEELYKAQFGAYVQLVEHLKVETVLHDMIDSVYTIPPDLQVWTSEVMFPRLAAAGLKRVALLESEDFIVNLSVEQTMQEHDAEELLFETQYFSDQSEALEWALGEKVVIPKALLRE